MKYRVEKLIEDGRVVTRGIILPDGFYRVISLTRKNFKHMQGLEDRGYMLTELPDNDGTVCGLYEEGSDRLVDPESAYVWASPLPEHEDAKLRYIAKDKVKTYVDDLQHLGLNKQQIREIKRNARMSKAQREAMATKAQVEKSRDSGLRDVAGMMGIQGNNAGEIEDAVREKLGS